MIRIRKALDHSLCTIIVLSTLAGFKAMSGHSIGLNHRLSSTSEANMEGSIIIDHGRKASKLSGRNRKDKGMAQLSSQGRDKPRWGLKNIY